MHGAGDDRAPRENLGPIVKRLSMSQCPACARENADAALECAACGTPLVMRCPACDTINVRTRRRCHHCAAVLDPRVAPQALPPEEPSTLPEVVPLLDPADDEVPADWTLSLRAEPAPPSMSDLPDILLPADDPPSRWPADPDAPDSASGALPTARMDDARAADHAELAARRARRRAAVRDAQRRQSVPPGAVALRDVLVLEADPRSRAEICRTLELFGFRPHVAVSTAEAEGLSLRQLHVAAFLGLGSDYDAEDTEALCRRLHDAPRGRPLALIAVGDRRRHADRIRMQLAGADRMLFRPVSRGDIARALDDCGLRMPRDPRDHPGDSDRGDVS